MLQASSPLLHPSDQVWRALCGGSQSPTLPKRGRRCSEFRRADRFNRFGGAGLAALDRCYTVLGSTVYTGLECRLKWPPVLERLGTPSAH